MRLSVPLALLALLGHSSANEVHVVAPSPGPGIDFTTITAAVAAANDGDIVLVKPGTYNFTTTVATVEAKSLTLVADGSVVPHGIVEVQNLGAGDVFSIRGFSSIDDLAIEANQVDGVLWSEDNILGNSSSICTFTDVARLNLLRTRFLAGATSVANSNLATYDSIFEGRTRGHPGFIYDTALFLDGGHLFASGTRLASVDLFGSIPDIFATNNPAVDLLDVDADHLPAHTILPGIARSYEASATVREGETLTLEAQGNPGDFVFAFVGTQPNQLILPANSGALLISPTLPPVFLGAIPPSGLLESSVTMPYMPPGVEGRVYYSQAVFYEVVGGTAILGPGSMVTLLDESL